MSVRRMTMAGTVVVLMCGTLLGPSASHVDASTQGRHAAAPVLRNYIAYAGVRTPDLTYSGKGLDVDRDGDEDLFISNHTRGGSLWRNTGQGRFTQTATYAWPRLNKEHKLIDRHNCAWADVDRNGRLDAYCSTGRTIQNYVKLGRGNELWIQHLDGTFVNRAAFWHVTDVCGRGRAVRFVNANGDQYPDLVLANARPRAVQDPCDTSPTLPNEKSKLWINEGGRSFHYAPAKLPLEAGMGDRCIVPVDYNMDGWQDLYLCQQSDETPLLFENRQGQAYVNVTAHHQLTGTVNDAAVADLDGDGDLDLVTATLRAFQYQLNDAGVFGGPVQIGAVPSGGDGWAVDVGDIDGDGDSDVYGMIGDMDLLTNPDDVVFLRDGLSFTSMPVPRAGGLADDVAMIHPWRSGQLGILVMNGYDHCCGPNAHKLGPIAMLRLET